MFDIIFTAMMKNMKSMFIKNVTSLGHLTAKCAEFHDRCIPQHVQKSMDRGIAACKHRQRRDQLQERKKVGREEAEIILKKERLEDLNVWDTCVPATSRTCRAITRKITSQIETANRESKGVSCTHTHISCMHMHIHIHNIHIHSLVCRCQDAVGQDRGTSE